jgi:hypothetical protein
MKYLLLASLLGLSACYAGIGGGRHGAGAHIRLGDAGYNSMVVPVDYYGYGHHHPRCWLERHHYHYVRVCE